MSPNKYRHRSKISCSGADIRSSDHVNDAGSPSPILKAISDKASTRPRGSRLFLVPADSLIWLCMSNLSWAYDMSLCSRPGVYRLDYHGRMVIGPTYCRWTAYPNAVGSIGVPTLGLSLASAQGPEEEPPPLEFFLTNCSQPRTDPDSIVGMRKGFEKPLKAEDWNRPRLDRRSVRSRRQCSNGLGVGKSRSEVLVNGKRREEDEVGRSGVFKKGSGDES
ncbi:hypothetical protein FNV43_RR12920 [Rhamnella rubrinervis]|uniref:Uncharacterized protein n=1 Tax=Rhamnella rubrinervis TaxID=2594499 RepID=A0A8K0H092_9ROSA|nr:hypothetical protein FNV43_RR12920 [Rhamnella rubrinervis]